MTIELTKKQIDKCFENQTSQSDVLINIYKEVFHDWDKIKQLNQYVEAGVKLWEYICDKFMEFDRTYHPNIISGGLWLKQGFSCLRDSDGKTIGEFEVIYDESKITYEEVL